MPDGPPEQPAGPAGAHAHLLEPHAYLLRTPGKNVRALLIEGFDCWLRVPRAKLDVIKDVVATLHTASLLIDDVEDDSELRRGVPVAHKIYGVPATINCANYVYFLALQRTLELGGDAVRIFTDEMIKLHEGQGQDIHWRDAGECPTQDAYVEMVRNKTGGLLRLGVKLMQDASDSTIDCVPLVDLMGIHYQIRDDLMNLCSATYTTNKGFAEDISEGKFSFPVIHAIRSAGDSTLLKILKQRTTDVELKRFAVSVLDKAGSFAYTREYLAALEAQCLGMIRGLGGNETLEGIVRMLQS